jgi:hypothetical protein
MHAVATGAEAGFMNCIRNTEKGIVIIARKHETGQRVETTKYMPSHLGTTVYLCKVAGVLGRVVRNLVSW